jgi:prephenate dehydratase
MFYVDLEADAERESFQPVLDRLTEKTEYLQMLGSY